MNEKVNPYKTSFIKMLRLQKDVTKWEHVISAVTTESRPTPAKIVENSSVYSVERPIRRHATTASQKAAVAVVHSVS